VEYFKKELSAAHGGTAAGGGAFPGRGAASTGNIACGEHEVLTVEDSSGSDGGDNEVDDNDDGADMLEKGDDVFEKVPASGTAGSGKQPRKRQRQEGGDLGEWWPSELPVSGWSDCLEQGGGRSGCWGPPRARF